MNWDRLEGQWKQQRGKAEHYWGKIMNDELAAVLGKHEELVGKLQEKHGIAKEKAKQQMDLFNMQCTACRLRTAEQLKKSHNKLMDMQKMLSKKKKLTKIKLTSRTPSRIKTIKGKQKRLVK